MKKNELKIGNCGINCGECPVMLATISNENDKRNEVAKQWSKVFNMKLLAKDINCKGCHSKDKPHFFYWNDCEIRQCSQIDKEFDNCASCPDYPCENIDKFHSWCSFAKPNLEKIRNSNFQGS